MKLAFGVSCEEYWRIIPFAYERCYGKGWSNLLADIYGITFVGVYEIMKLKFENQDFQEAATAALCDVFEGRPYHYPNVYTVDPGRKGVRNQESGVSVGSSLPGFETLS